MSPHQISKDFGENKRRWNPTAAFSLKTADLQQFPTHLIGPNDFITFE